jgi:putative ABC transport system permease protein
MAKGMSSMFHQPDVYSPDKVLTLHPDLPIKRYDTPEKQAEWYINALDRLGSIPGISRVELATALPYTDSGWQLDLTIENRPTTPGKLQTAVRLAVTPGYFDAFHIPILDGRNFAQGDSVHSVPVAIVSRRFADLYFGGANPIGHRIRLGDSKSHDPWLTIVGVSQEANYSLWENDLAPAVYTSFAQQPLAGSTIAILAKGDPLSLAAPARKALASIDATVPIDPVQTYRALIRDNLVGLMYAASMLAIDALIALLLSAIGIFAVMANLVGERTREIGVRLAMGASKEDVLRMIIRRASWLTGTGLVIGLTLAFALARLVANLLRGVRPDDPMTFAAVTLVIVAVALAASWFPARQASRVDPMQALRSE